MPVPQRIESDFNWGNIKRRGRFNGRLKHASQVKIGDFVQKPSTGSWIKVATIEDTVASVIFRGPSSAGTDGRLCIRRDSRAVHLSPGKNDRTPVAFTVTPFGSLRCATCGEQAVALVVGADDRPLRVVCDTHN